MDCLNGIGYALLVSPYLIKYSGPSVKGDSHGFVGIHKGLKFIRDAGVLYLQGGVVALQGSDFSLQV